MPEPLQIDPYSASAAVKDRQQRWLMFLLTLEEHADSVEVDPLALSMAKQQVMNSAAKSRRAPLELPARRHRCRHP